jgi:hypothetical protein
MTSRLPILAHVRHAAVVAVAIALLSRVAAAAADPILLDQLSQPTQSSNDAGSTFAGLSEPDGTFRRAQTFTVGRDGRLARIDVLLIGDSADLLLQVLDVAGGVPDAVLASTHSVVNTADGWRTFALTDRMLVASGRVLAIELVNVLGRSFAWRGQEPGPRYKRGGDFFKNVHSDVPSFTPNPMHDNYFRTFVEAAAPIPEPATLVLALSGLAALSGRRRRPRRK